MEKIKIQELNDFILSLSKDDVFLYGDFAENVSKSFDFCLSYFSELDFAAFLGVSLNKFRRLKISLSSMTLEQYQRLRRLDYYLERFIKFRYDV